MVKIISDSTCDLSEELVRKYEVEIIPLHIVLGNEEYLDGKNITPEDIYRWSDQNKTTPKTSAVSMESAMDTFRSYLEAGMEIVCFSISSDMSTTGNVMRLAAEELGATDHVWVVDSANLSTGIGLLVVKAAIMAKEGKNAAEIADQIEEIKPKVRSSFVVDTLTYLYRGGRCSGLAAMAGSVLKMHPKIVVENGKMRPAEKYRGKMSNVIINYVKAMEEDLKKADKDRVFITHSGSDEEIIREVHAYLESLNIFKEILITRAGGVISSHCGPGTLGVLYIQKSI